MDHQAGIDVSLERSNVCLVDATGKVIAEAKVDSEPEALLGRFRARPEPVAGIGLEAGPLSQWLFAALEAAGLPTVLLETRHVRAAFKTMSVKTDRKDARGIARLMRLGWFRPVRCKSVSAQETRALLTARKPLQGKRLDGEMRLRGVLRGVGLKLGATTPKTFAARVRALVAGHPTLETVSAALLAARETLLAQFKALERGLMALGRADERVRQLIGAPGMGAPVALTFTAAIDDPGRFRASRQVGAHFGLTPRRCRSGETDVTGRVAKVGDHGVRVALCEAANAMSTRPVKGSALEDWALAVARRSGPKKARVALARKLAMVMHRMLTDGAYVEARPAAAAAAAWRRRRSTASGGARHPPA